MNRRERRRQGRRNRKAEPPATRAAVVDELLTRASQHIEAGETDDAEALLRQATAQAPTDAEAYHMLALIAYQQGRLVEAGEFILEATTRDDTDVTLHANCGAMMNMLGRAREAEAACRHVIELQPDHAEAHNNLAVALEVQGRIEEAFAAGAEAVRLRPDYPEAHINLGLNLRSGNLIEAVETYAEAIKAAPANPMARANLSVALRELGEIAEAENQSRAAIDINPDYAEAHNAFGNVLVVKGEPEQAIAAFERAAELRPEYAEARINRAAALFKSGRSGDAEAAYRDIVDDHDELAEAHAGLGVVLLAAGRLDEATAAFRRAVELNPNLGDAQYNLVCADGANLSGGEIDALGDLANDDKLSPRDRIGHFFALGEAADQQGDAESAFVAFESGNALRKSELKKIGWAFDPDAYDRMVDDIIAEFDTVPAGGDRPGNLSEVPVFVVGVPRSGTTLIEQIAASHPLVHGAGEIESLDGVTPGDAGAAEAVLERLRAPAGEVRVIDKTPSNLLHLGAVQSLFPRARVVLCRRDLLDTGVSCFFQNFVDAHPWTTDLEHIGRLIRASERLAGYWRKALTLPLLDVAYEDVLLDQEGQTRRLIEFLGLEWDDACLRFHETERPVLTASNWQVRKPLYSASKGRASRYESHLVALRAGLAGEKPPA